MKIQLSCILLVCFIFTACSPIALEQRVLNTDNEILYNAVVQGQVPADQIVFFGVKLGDSEETVRALHGEPRVEQEFTFGRDKNLEYAFGENSEQTTVLYHFERGSLVSVLVNNNFKELSAYDSLLSSDTATVYSVLGIPTASKDLTLQRVFFYDDLGYEVYIRKKAVDRIYFTSPNRGIIPTGINISTYQDTNSSQSICAQVIVYAQNPDTGLCEEFSTPCDVPSDWQSCEQ